MSALRARADARAISRLLAGNGTPSWTDPTPDSRFRLYTVEALSGIIKYGGDVDVSVAAKSTVDRREDNDSSPIHGGHVLELIPERDVRLQIPRPREMLQFWTPTTDRWAYTSHTSPPATARHKGL